MKLFVACGFAIAGLLTGVPAFAADLGVKPAAVMPESDALSWSGGYIGANVGYGWGHSGSSYDNQVGPFVGVNPDTDPAGVLGGVTLGANQEIGNNLVIGVEGDIDYANLTDTIDDQAALNNSRPGQTITATTDWTGTLRGRVGVAVDKILPYLTAGLAVAHSTVSATDGPLSDSATLPPVLGQVEHVLVGQPGELRRHLVALAVGGGDVHHEATFDMGDDDTLDAADIVDIGDDAFADIARHWRNDHRVAGRHRQHLAGEFPAVGKHVAAKEGHLDPLESRHVRLAASSAGDCPMGGHVRIQHV